MNRPAFRPRLDQSMTMGQRNRLLPECEQVPRGHGEIATRKTDTRPIPDSRGRLQNSLDLTGSNYRDLGSCGLRSAHRSFSRWPGLVSGRPRANLCSRVRNIRSSPWWSTSAPCLLRIRYTRWIRVGTALLRGRAGGPGVANTCRAARRLFYSSSQHHRWHLSLNIACSSLAPRRFRV